MQAGVHAVFGAPDHEHGEEDGETNKKETTQSRTEGCCTARARGAVLEQRTHFQAKIARGPGFLFPCRCAFGPLERDGGGDGHVPGAGGRALDRKSVV